MSPSASVPSVLSWLCAELRVLRKRIAEVEDTIRPRRLCLDELIAHSFPVRPPGVFCKVFDSEDVPVALNYKEQDTAAKDAINDAMREGRIGYNTAVDLGFPSLIDQAEKDFDLATAIGIENKYGLERGQVTPGFGSFSYQGPNSTAAALGEIGSAAKSLATAYYDMYSQMPSLTGTALGLMGIAAPGSTIGLAARSDVFGLNPISEVGQVVEDATEALGLSSIPSSIDEAGLGLAQAAAEEATGLDLSASAIAEGLFDSVFDTEEEENAFTGFETTDLGLSSNLGSPSASVADIGSQAESPEESIDPGGDELIPRPQPTPIPSPPQIASLPAQNIFREPVTRTAAADTFSILSRIYGPEVARQLAPNRTV